ncbi:MAG: four helix bundle protein [Candidatus Saccharibacteria bacterium]|nr:four helix bundle protein [Candidatus Saccharibacteria bacterium]
MGIESFKDIIAWQKARELTTDVYGSFSTCKDYGFRDQIQRAAVSIMNNIAEGYAKQSNKSLRNYLYIAKGSAFEVESMLIVAKDLGYLNDKNQKKLLSEVIEVSKLLSGFIRKLPS